VGERGALGEESFLKGGRKRNRALQGKRKGGRPKRANPYSPSGEVSMSGRRKGEGNRKVSNGQ